jgi:stage III sporulation protein AG
MNNKTDLIKTASKEKNRKILIALGLFAGVILIILSFFTTGNKNTQNNSIIKSDLSRIETNSYISEQEKKLCEMLKRINGVSEPFVMITIDSSSEYIYASKQTIKESSSKNGETTQKEVHKDIILYEDEKKSKSPILVKEIQPKIKGVAVVCKGISNADMQLKIINLVSTVLNLPTNKVYVISAD